MRFERIRRTFNATIFIVFACAWTARGGDLNPPAGPVAPTMKTLDEVEPRIVVNAVNTPGDASATFVISQSGSYYLMGNITGEAGKHGIRVDTDHVSIDLNGFALLGVAGSSNGIRSNSGQGMRVSNGVIADWDALGVNVGEDSEVSDLIVRNTGSTGIVTQFYCRVTRCVVRNAGGDGISVRIGSAVSHCTIAWSGARGVLTEGSCLVSDSTAISNTMDGFRLASGSTITRCIANGNQSDGINVTANTIVLQNFCSGNGVGAGDGAGIHATTGGDNRIEGNTCTGSDRGIDVDSAGNIIVRNTCSGNTTNWDVVAGNVCLVVSATTAAAILGNSGGVAPGSTDPNANFTY